jgi:hypothetical protein
MSERDEFELDRVELTPALAELERVLTGVSVAPQKLNVSQLMFRAGQESGRRSAARRGAWLWRSAGVVAASAAAALVTWLSLGMPPKVVERIVYVGHPGTSARGTELAATEADATAAGTDDRASVDHGASGNRERSTDTASSALVEATWPISSFQPGYYRTVEMVVAYGADVLPRPTVAIDHPLSSRQLQQELLRTEGGGRSRDDAPLIDWNELIPSDEPL